MHDPPRLQAFWLLCVRAWERGHQTLSYAAADSPNVGQIQWIHVEGGRQNNPALHRSDACKGNQEAIIRPFQL